MARQEVLILWRSKSLANEEKLREKKDNQRAGAWGAASKHQSMKYEATVIRN